MDKGVKDDSKKLPYRIVLSKQFPLAIEALVKRSLYGHEKYIDDDGDWMNWRRIDSPIERYDDAMVRHALGIGEDSELEHLAATAWNALAILQLKLEKMNENKENDVG